MGSLLNVQSVVERERDLKEESKLKLSLSFAERRFMLKVLLNSSGE